MAGSLEPQYHAADIPLPSYRTAAIYSQIRTYLDRIDDVALEIGKSDIKGSKILITALDAVYRILEQPPSQISRIRQLYEEEKAKAEAAKLRKKLIKGIAKSNKQ